MNNDIAKARLARVPVGIRESLLSSSHRPPGAITAVARFFDAIAVLAEDSTAPSRRVFEVDLPGFSGERLAHFPCLSLEGDGALEAER